VLLCVDIGNTQIALGLYADEPGTADDVDPPLVRDWRMRTDPRMTADELDVALTALLGPYAGRVTGIAALSTVPTLLRELRLLIDRRDVPAVVVGPGVRTGVPLLVDNPREVGADRVMNTLAAHRLYSTACIVVDFGTSTNIDVVSAKGEFLGGALAPGIEISMEALATRAAALRTVELVRPRSVIGKNTVECLQSGVLFGFAGQVDGLVRRILAELGPKAGAVTVLGTGGLAPLVSGESETIAEFVPDLTLLGLRLTYLRNAAGSAPLVSSVAMPAPRRSPAAARTSPTTSPGESRGTP
jgi:type III pantothenate kinase